MGEGIEVMAHDHVKVAVEGSAISGVEFVPAQDLGAGKWLLLRSPLYASRLAAGDTIRIVGVSSGAFEILSRGGNVGIHFYLPESQRNDARATEVLAKKILPFIQELGGDLDGHTAGLMVFTIPVLAGFRNIESALAEAIAAAPGAEWEYTNVYDLTTGAPLGWWEDVIARQRV